jgi:hypothetical protein
VVVGLLIVGMASHIRIVGRRDPGLTVPKVFAGFLRRCGTRTISEGCRGPRAMLLEWTWSTHDPSPLLIPDPQRRATASADTATTVAAATDHQS